MTVARGCERARDLLPSNGLAPVKEMPCREQACPQSDVAPLAQHRQTPSPVDNLDKLQDTMKVLARPKVMDGDLDVVAPIQHSLHYAGQPEPAIHHDKIG